MKRVLIAFAVMGLAISASGFAADDDGWVDLFNGKDLDGWEVKNGKATYRVEDGAIVGTSAPNSPNTFLCTKKHFGDFVLEFEFKAHPALNSGAQFRSNSLESYKNGRVHGYHGDVAEQVSDTQHQDPQDAAAPAAPFDD